MKKLLIAFAVLLVILGLLFALRMPILEGCGTVLMHEDKLQQADAMFVLSGGGYDRGNEAVKIFNQGYAKQIICTGGNTVTEFKVFGIDTLESEMTFANLKRQAVADSSIILLKYGTSTREEADSILSYCKIHQLKRVIILSSLLHTGRVDKVFRKPFTDTGIDLIIHGAPSSRFDEYHWWQSEDGLIAVNNEWIKTVYYWWLY